MSFWHLSNRSQLTELSLLQFGLPSSFPSSPFFFSFVFLLLPFRQDSLLTPLRYFPSFYCLLCVSVSLCDLPPCPRSVILRHSFLNQCLFSFLFSHVRYFLFVSNAWIHSSGESHTVNISEQSKLYQQQTSLSIVFLSFWTSLINLLMKPCCDYQIFNQKCF